MLKRTNEEGRQSLWGFPRPEITWQEQCIVWIPPQCGVPDAKRANSYSAAMVMTCKTGESPSNGATPKVDGHPFQTRRLIRPLIERERNKR